MMTKTKTSRKISTIYLLLLPAVCFLLFAFSRSSSYSPGMGDDAARMNAGQVVMIVDAGHGGADAGVQGIGGLRESDFALSMAESILTAGHENGVTVILTRTGDNSLSLEDRLRIANGASADFFVSLHANFDGDNASTSGIECIVSEKSIASGQKFAEQLINGLKTLRGIEVNGIKNSDPLILRKNTIPSVILELGYLSNSADAHYITDVKNQKLVSEQIMAAAKAYKK